MNWLFIFHIALTCLTIYTLNAHELDDGVMKYTRASCSSSGKNIANISCRVRPVSRKEGYLSFVAQLIRPLKNVLVDYILYHKPLIGGNYVQIIKLEKLNGCDLIKTAANNILYRFFLEFANETIFKGIIRECPYPVGEYKIENATLDVNFFKKWDTFQRFPNGERKNNIRIFNKLDDNILTMTIFDIVNLRSNTLNSFDKM